MSNNCSSHPAIVPGVESVFLCLRKLFLEEGLIDGDGGQKGCTLRLGLGKLFGRHPGFVGPRAVHNDGHDWNSGLAVRALCAGRKLVKSPVIKIGTNRGYSQ
jgi:hypothetical protein